MPALPKDFLAPDKWGAITDNHLYAWVGPWGASFAANLTPDKETGIGNWTVDMFKTVLRTGKYHDGSRPLLPPMPWQNYAGATDEELNALFAFLQSLPPIANKVPDPIPPDKLGLAPPAPAPKGK